jgi:hypothetical protein
MDWLVVISGVIGVIMFILGMLSIKKKRKDDKGQQAKSE